MSIVRHGGAQATPIRHMETMHPGNGCGGTATRHLAGFAILASLRVSKENCA